MQDKKGEVSFGAIVATIGSILVGLGVAWLLALNWHEIPSGLKVVILAIATIAAYASGVMLRINSYEKIGESLILLGSILYTLSIFLIAQIFSINASMQGTANLMLLAWVGVIITSYIFSSKSTLVIGLGQFLIWISLQYFSFRVESIGLLALIYLGIAVLLYGLNLYHKSNDHIFSMVYRYWTALYVLLISYLLSFQILLPMFWPKGLEITVGHIIFTLILSAFALLSFIVGMYSALEKGKLTAKEAFSFVGLVLMYVLLISLTSLASGGRVSIFGGGNLSPALFFIWILNNILFILVILSVIGYGTRYKSEKIVNLGISFFALEIITRYIGFIMDFGGQIGFAVVSIFGGVILIFGGWLIEKWRKRLIDKTKQKQPNYLPY